MMTNPSEFPDAILEQGVDGEEFLFFSQESDGKKIFYVPMKAGKNSVTKVTEPVDVNLELPVYVQLMSRYIFTGTTGKASLKVH